MGVGCDSEGAGCSGGSQVSQIKGQLELFPTIAPASAGALDPDRLDGLACLVCGRGDVPMAPVGYLAGGQVFVCETDLPMVSADGGAACRAEISNTCGVRWTEET